jgi:hypothetical protein
MAKELFRSSIKKLTQISQQNLSIGFDHNHQILLGEDNRTKLRKANNLILQAIEILEEIKAAQ